MCMPVKAIHISTVFYNYDHCRDVFQNMKDTSAMDVLVINVKLEMCIWDG